MSFSTSSLLSRQIVSTGASTTIGLPFAPTGVRVYDITKINANVGSSYRWAWWKSAMTAGSAVIGTSNAGNTDVLETIVAGTGISVVDTSQPNLGAIVGPAGTISQAAVAVVTQAAHPFVTGDIVQLTNTTGMLQIAGADFSITKTGANTYTLDNLDTQAGNGFAAAATAVTARKVGNQPYYYPRRRFITKMSKAVNMLVTMSTVHGYQVNQKIRLVVPASFGMTQANGILATITAIGVADTSGATNTISLDVDSTAFSTFAWPASFVNYFGQFAEVVPVGDNTPTLSGATLNTASFLVTLGTSVVGASLDVLAVDFERATLI